MENQEQNEVTQSTPETTSEPQTSESKQNIMEKLGVPGAIIIAGIIVAGSILFTDKNDNAPVAPTNPGAPQEEVLTEEQAREILAIKEDDWVLGNRDAEIYIVEYSDTTCPHCQNFHVTMNQIVEEYQGEVAWVYRNFPVLQGANTRQTEALECAGLLAGNDGFWEYTNALYEIPKEQQRRVTNDDLPQLASEIGLDVTAFNECLDSGETKLLVTADFQEARTLGGNGTPFSFILGGEQIVQIPGAQPYDVVKASIDQILVQ